MSTNALEGLNTPQAATRLLKLLEYPHDEIVAAIEQQYKLSHDEAEAIVSAAD